MSPDDGDQPQLVLSYNDYLLICLAEELDEVGQRIMKALRFGIHQKQKGHELDNAERIQQELLDLQVVIGLLDEAGVFKKLDRLGFDAEEHEQVKRAKLKQYYDFSVSLGRAEPL